jgi:hypothetical protein
LDTHPTRSTAGRVIHRAFRYELLVGWCRWARSKPSARSRSTSGVWQADLHARGAGAHNAGNDHFDLSTLVPLLGEFGLMEIESGAVAFSLLPIERLHYVLTAAPTDL